MNCVDISLRLRHPQLRSVTVINRLDREQRCFALCVRPMRYRIALVHHSRGNPPESVALPRETLIGAVPSAAAVTFRCPRLRGKDSD